MFEVLVLTFAFFFGLAVKQVGLPPLVGFLIAGFGLNALGKPLGLPHDTGEILDHIAHLGVLMLLFTVGLKLKLQQLVQPQVIGGSLAHVLISVALFAPGLHYLMGLDWHTAVLVGTALALSSTVLAAKSLESKREIGAFHGRVAIGILIIQDLIALAVIAVEGGQTPSIWALWILALPLLRPVMHWLLDLSGHDELMVLMGMLLAVVVGGMGFSAVGVSAEIGALLMGVMLSSHRKAAEMSESLWSLKEIFLVGFFLQIGMQGLPDWGDLAFALVFAVLLPLKGILFFFLLVWFRLRARNAFLAGLSLTAYSEFGLIVSSAVLPEWLVPLAITVALSFLISAPLNRYAHPLFERFQAYLEGFESPKLHPDEEPTKLGDANIIVMGMGRTGTAAYDTLSEHGARVIGLDADPYHVAHHKGAGKNVVYTDAEDAHFWHRVDLTGIDAVVLAMDALESKLISARQLRARGFTGKIIASALHQDQVEQILAAGASATYLTKDEAGVGLAEHTWQAMGGDVPAKPADE